MLIVANPPNPPSFVSNKDTMGGLGQLYPADSISLIPPIDLLYVAAALRMRNVSFKVVDCLGGGIDVIQFLNYLQTCQPSMVAVRTSLPSFEWDLEVVALIKQVTKAKVLLFGPCIEFLQEKVLAHESVDGAIVGEPELVLPDIVVNGLSHGHPSLLSREVPRENSIERAMVDCLDELPFPAWDLLPYDAYACQGLMRDVSPFVTMLTSRGCPHGCSYCPYPVVQGRKIRFRTVENVLDELKWLQMSLGVKAVLFRDPEFAFNRERIVKICEGMISNNIQIAWRCETRAENIDPELLELMAKAGCIGINMGVESCDNNVLRNIGRKPISQEKVLSVIKVAKKNAIDTFCFFVLGLPGETFDSSMKTINFALRLNPMAAQFTVATPYPGTQLYEWATERGYLEKVSYEQLTGYDSVMRNEYLSVEDINSLRIYAHTAWEMRGLLPLRRIVRLFLSMILEVKKWIVFIGARNGLFRSTRM